jgi:hypothetical protein
MGSAGQELRWRCAKLERGWAGLGIDWIVHEMAWHGLGCGQSFIDHYLVMGWARQILDWE